MRSEIVKESDEIVYPCLMEAENGVVLFTNNEIGTVVSVYPIDRYNNWSLGNYSARWDFKGFKPFTGKVILTNK
jgi:hypothetical protein